MNVLLFFLLPRWFDEFQLFMYRRAFVTRWSGITHETMLGINVATLVASFCFPLHQTAGIQCLAFAFTGAFLFDSRLRLIPDRFHIFGVAGSLLFMGSNLTASHFLIPALAFGSLWFIGKVYERTRRQPSMGLGDIKILTWMSLLLQESIVIVIVVAIVIALVQVTLQRRTRVAFGPPIIAGFLAFIVLRNFNQLIF